MMADDNEKKRKEESKHSNDNFSQFEEQVNHYRSYLHEAISSSRILINDRLNQIIRPSKTAQTLLTTKDSVIQSLKSTSELLNRDYPYFSSLCRSHESLLLFSAVILTAFSPLKRAPKILYRGGILVSAASVFGTIQLVNFKWQYGDTKEKK